MAVSDYQNSGRTFEKNGICFAVTRVNGLPRAACWSSRESNDNGTNGIRLENGFYALPTSDEIEEMANVLAYESREHGIQFIKDDEMTEEEGCFCIYYYKMQLLRSPVVMPS